MAKMTKISMIKILQYPESWVEFYSVSTVETKLFVLINWTE